MLLEHIRFKNRQALKIEVTSQNDLPRALKTLGLTEKQPAIVIVGGAGNVNDKDWAVIKTAVDMVVEIAQVSGAAVIDGGTNAGVMAAAGQSRAQNRYQFPLIGVCAIDTATWPGRSRGFWRKFRDQRAPLEPNHTHFILVPGKSWGDESPWIAETATQLAGAYPSLTVLINGGQISRDQDVPNNLKAGRTVFVIEGTGRAADELASHPPDSARMRFIHISEFERFSSELQEHLKVS